MTRFINAAQRARMQELALQAIYPQRTKRPRWPKVIGAISIVYALVAVALSGFALARMCAILLDDRSVSLLRSAGADGLESIHRALFLNGMMLLSEAALFVGGILLWKRRPAARLWHLGFVLVALSVELVSVGLAACNAYKHWGQFPPAMRSAILRSYEVFLIELLAWAVYPVFLLVWFYRPTIVAEVRGWKLPKGGGILADSSTMEKQT